LNHYNTQLEDAVQKQTAHILDMQNKMILGMANIVESRDNSTGGHIKRTSEVVRILVEELKCENLFTDILTKEYCEYIVKAAPMHDLGKIAIEDRVLKKPGKYTREEYEEMKKHAANGAQIVETILKDVEDEPFVNISKNIAHYHHEKWDGTGYPEGLHGDAIPLEARIMALADVYDAIVSKRCYKEKMPYDQAVIIIEESIGKHFDPVIGAAFLKCREQVEAFYQNAEES
ncbi:MAG TPA: HD domain-containing protein, partial [Lachnospiraceae bacterium]|nr:HD domain-containing protein [Lachnospiraceae bacterium]